MGKAVLIFILECKDEEIARILNWRVSDLLKDFRPNVVRSTAVCVPMEEER
ncbi:hypothetical protein J7L81_00720 [Candidatus Aerophobetes bacterium]|nr:hypothetical protein [Candidatus Aerophobetes bacterium]